MEIKKRVLILFAHMKEANSFLHQSELKFIKVYKNEFQFENNYIAITVLIIGIGKSFSDYLKNFNTHKIDVVIKAGTCAIIDSSEEILIPFIPRTLAFDGKEITMRFNGQFPMELKKLLKEKKLLTIEKPLSDKNEAKELSKNYSYIDMEVFYAAEQFRSSFFLPILVGTDQGDANSKVDFFKNIGIASEILKKEILKILQLISGK